MNRFFSLLTLLVAFLFAGCGSENTPAIATSGSEDPTSAIAVKQTPAEPTDEILPTPTSSTGANEAFVSLREEMVQSGIVDWGVVDESVIAAMLAVPRHEFVPQEYLNQAYENHPLPIGFGQTISQPYIVARMTEAIGVSSGDKVLEVGTGSGYQAAVLAEIVDNVYSVEIIGELLEIATETHDRVGYDNIITRHTDGYFGWEEEAPFDAIIVTAAPDHVPIPLVQQLEIGGRMIIPVGPVGGFQRLWLITRVSENEITSNDLGGVSFVPLTRETRES